MVNHIEHFLKTYRAKLHAEQLIKLVHIGSFGTVACSTDAGGGLIWILDGVLIDRGLKHTQ